ncbi:hypothetical protein HYR54_05555 [Candidatus Acetothermia bacterium]|nr:hypothetical protein [Candidatus Acetothermia bacterium]
MIQIKTKAMARRTRATGFTVTGGSLGTPAGARPASVLVRLIIERAQA